MTEIGTIVQTARLGMQAADCINKVKLNDDLKRMEWRIQEIQAEATRLGDKVANAHFLSALGSLNNIRLGNDARTEIRAAIHHLYDAYNVEREFLDKKLSFDQYLFCNKTAALVSALHLYLNEQEIARQWKKRAIEDYDSAQAIYDNSKEFQALMGNLFHMIDPKGYIEIVASAIRNTVLGNLQIITESQYIVFGSQYAFMKDLQVGIGPFKKSLLKAYFLSSSGQLEVCYKLREARYLVNNIHVMIEIPEKNVYIADELTDSWDEIIANVKNGTYRDKYKIGDKKTCDFASEGSVVMQIAAFDRDVKADREKAAITWVGVKPLDRPISMGDVACSWEESSLRKFLNNHFFELLPLCLKNNIVPVWKYDKINGEYQNFTLDKIWIPSFYEVFGKKQYEIFNTNYGCYSWWLRTPQRFDRIESIGYFYYYRGVKFNKEKAFDEQLRYWASEEDFLPCCVINGVLPCFCI